MKNLINIFWVFFMLSCSSQDCNSEVMFMILHGDSIYVSNNDQCVEIVLEDTAYTFMVSDIKEISYDENRSLGINRCVFNDLGINTTGQSSVIINDTVLSFNTGGAAITTSIKYGERRSFEPECISYHPHCNVANYYNCNGKHYVYLSEWDGKHRCFVEELWHDANLNKWNSRLVQILSLDIDDAIRGSGNMDWIVDQDNDMIYVQTYKDGTSGNATGLIYLQFPLPSITKSGDIVLNKSQILRRVEYPMIYITQDKFIYKNKMYIASGWGKSVPGKVTVIDLKNFVEEETYDLSYRDDEPEGITIYKDNLLVFYWGKNYSVQNKESLFIKLKNGICLSYPIARIKHIQVR